MGHEKKLFISYALWMKPQTPHEWKSGLFKHFMYTVLEIIKYSQSKGETDKTTLETLFFSFLTSCLNYMGSGYGEFKCSAPSLWV